ncbi:MAG: FAD:protein FMN transferase [Bacillota bacterium]|jgi:thiamine biosynthesis lipoprotein|nr:FAD:protein FMN transferase [Bacillota bacterium]HHU43686.1 FAD:protein FMN transferase [Clostridiales bacterium]
MKKLKPFLVILVALIFIMSGCTASSGENLIFGSFYSIQLKGVSARSALKKIHKTLVEIENQISTVIETSDVYKINQAKVGEPVKIGKHTLELFKASMELYELTDKAFNPAVYPLVELWSFSPDKLYNEVEEIPPHEDIIELLQIAQMELFQLDEESQTITKSHDNAKLDFGGIAKGYAIDKVKELVKDYQALINIGGDILPYSRKANIGVTHPRENGLFGVVNLKDLIISTSGDYERYYIIDGTRYSHIIGKNGYPASLNEFDIISASVIGEKGMYCDALATAIIVSGLDWAENIEQLGYSALVIIQNTTKGEEYYNIIGDIQFEPSRSAYRKNINL